MLEDAAVWGVQAQQRCFSIRACCYAAAASACLLAVVVTVFFSPPYFISNIKSYLAWKCAGAHCAESFSTKGSRNNLVCSHQRKPCGQMIQEHNICESEKEFCSAGLQLRARGRGILLVVARLLPCITAQPRGCASGAWVCSGVCRVWASRVSPGQPRQELWLSGAEPSPCSCRHLLAL